MARVRIIGLDSVAADAKARVRRSQRGFVLVAAIWLAGLIAAVAVGFVVSVRVNVLLGAASVHNAEAELAADGMARLTAWRLATAPQGADGTTAAGVCRWNAETTVAVAVQDEAGLVDLNAAPEFLLSRLLGGLGAPPREADALAAAIGDFRDADSEATTGGMEPATYAGHAFGPKNGPFEAIEELDQIPGMSEDLYRRLLPLTTVHALQPGLDPAAAPAALKALLGFGAGDQPPDDLAGLMTASPMRFFRIDVAVEGKRWRYRRIVTVDLIRQPDRPFAILSWQRGGDFTIEGKATGNCLN